MSVSRETFIVAEIALLGRLLYKFRNAMRGFKVYQRLHGLYKVIQKSQSSSLMSSIDLNTAQDIKKRIDKCSDEISELLRLGHNLPFLLLSLAAIARLNTLLVIESKNPTPDRLDRNDDSLNSVTNGLSTKRLRVEVDDEDMGELV